MKLSAILLAGTAAVAFSASAAIADRGSDGTVKIIYWQAPSILNPFLSGGTKDVESSSLVIEPLARYNEKGELVPWLVDEIPTLENGGVSPDLKSITWKLKDGLKWSDGTPVTSADAVFTAEYCMHPEGGCAQLSKYEGVDKVEAVDDLTIKVTFKEPKPNPYGPLVGAQSPIIQKKQFAGLPGRQGAGMHGRQFWPDRHWAVPRDRVQANDVIQLEANPNYRDPAKPAFAKVTVQGRRRRGGGRPGGARDRRISTTPGTCNWRRTCWRKWQRPARASRFPPSAPWSSASR